MEKNAQTEILNYLQDNKSANTFTLARSLGIDRSKLKRELTKLHERGLIEYRTGMVRFLSMPNEMLGHEEPTQKISKQKTEIHRIKKQILSANIKPAEEGKKLGAKLAGLKKQAAAQNQLQKIISAQAAHIEDLKRQAQKLTRKAAAVKTKIIRKVIVRQIPIKMPKTPVKESEEKLSPKRPDVDVRKSPTGKSWLSDIGKLNILKLFEQKIELKRASLNLGKLKEDISRLEIPDILKKNGDEND